ncbi:MAG: hypothetical protein ACRDJC_17060 [Thermomicrobiales bacterium]
MHADRFDAALRSFTHEFSRRLVRRGLIAAVLGLAPARLAGAASAKKRRRKPRPNAFGCLNVGAPCRNANDCCSGVCKGKKRKKRCHAHDSGDCPSGPVACSSQVSCTTNTGFVGECLPTTGKAVYCASVQPAQCVACVHDRDCISTLGETAACVVCDDACAETQGRKCVGSQGD